MLDQGGRCSHRTADGDTAVVAALSMAGEQRGPASLLKAVQGYLDIAQRWSQHTAGHILQRLLVLTPVAHQSLHPGGGCHCPGLGL